MKSKRAIKRLLLSVGLGVSALVCGQWSVRAENLSPVPVLDTSTVSAAKLAVRPIAPQVQDNSDQIQLSAASFSSDALTPQATTDVLASALAPAGQDAQLPLKQAEAPPASTEAVSLAADPTAPVVPFPGTVPTSVAAFTPDSSTALDVSMPATAERQQVAQSHASKVAQLDAVTPGRATRSGPSYVGLGANIGAIGRTPLGEFSGAILGKIGLTRMISFRPAVLINGDVTFLLPLTLDFPFERAGRVSLAPYVGVGASFSTGDRKNADLIITGGVDIPLSSQFTLTAGATAGLINGIELGVLVGIGYNFAGF